MNRRQRRALQGANAQNLQKSAETPCSPDTAAPASAPGYSTGPRTEEGKAVSSRNAVRHGLCATKLTGADLEALNAIRARLDQEWEPAT